MSAAGGISSQIWKLWGERTSESTSEHADGDRVAETIMVLSSIQATAQAKAQPVKMRVSRGGCNAGSQAMRVQSEPARLDDRRSIVALDAAGQGHARPTQGGHSWFVTNTQFFAAPEAPCASDRSRKKSLGVFLPS